MCSQPNPIRPSMHQIHVLISDDHQKSIQTPDVPVWMYIYALQALNQTLAYVRCH